MHRRVRNFSLIFFFEMSVEKFYYVIRLNKYRIMSYKTAFTNFQYDIRLLRSILCLKYF